MALIQFEITVEVRTEALRKAILDKTQLAVDAGAQKTVEYNQEQIANWDHPVTFKVTDDSKPNQPARLITCDDMIWQLVNLGNKAPKDIYGPIMVFPFQGVGNSYDAKTDGGSGARMGPILVTRGISQRMVRPRHMAQKVKDDHERDILAAMAAVIGAP